MAGGTLRGDIQRERHGHGTGPRRNLKGRVGLGGHGSKVNPGPVSFVSQDKERLVREVEGSGPLDVTPDPAAAVI